MLKACAPWEWASNSWGSRVLGQHRRHELGLAHSGNCASEIVFVGAMQGQSVWHMTLDSASKVLTFTCLQFEGAQTVVLQTLSCYAETQVEDLIIVLQYRCDLENLRAEVSLHMKPK